MGIPPDCLPAALPRRGVLGMVAGKLVRSGQIDPISLPGLTRQREAETRDAERRLAARVERVKVDRFLAEVNAFALAT